ncbi:alpha/beta hydrolase [Actinophytocola sediminis]
MLVLVAAGCTSTVDGSSAPDLPYEERGGPAGEVPADLAEFYGQALTWEGCGDYATGEFDAQPLAAPEVECTRLTVPLDYAKPDGETIRIGVLRRPATEQDDRVGSLVINPGGPGVAGLSTAAALAAENEDLAARFDFVGFDPRGVGSSEPTISCVTGEERDDDRADDSELDASGPGVAAAERENQDYAAKCVQRTEFGADMLANLGSRDVVKDMDVLRSALGDEQLTYLGYSYGTRIGSTYAETFPRSVRAMVLDGAVDPTKDAVEEVVAQGKGFQEAFDDFVAWCLEREDCPFDSAATANADYQALVRPLADNPIDLADGRPLSYEDATTGTVQALYSEQLWEHLQTGLNELRQHEGATLMSLADLYLERDRDGTYTTTQDAFVAIRCVDDPRVTDPAKVREVSRRYKEAAPFLDDGNPPSAARDSCAFWPVPNTSQPHLPKVDGIPPVLVISTTGDPATPYQAGVALAEALGGALLTFEATQHTVFLQGNACVDDAGVAYLVDGTLPEEGTRCQA